MPPPRLLIIIALAPACGSQRVQGYLDDLADCSQSTSAASTSGTTGPADTTTSTTDTTDTTDSTTSPATTTTSDADSSTTTAASTTTGDPPTVCGDGVLDDLGPLPEECDDANLDPDDGCSATCTLDIRVFVSSLQFKAGDIMSVHLADAKCANLAAQVDDPTYLKYRAWLSDSTTDARDHINVGRGRIVLVNGIVVADSWDALLAGQLQSPIEVTEKIETYHGGVWTGTRPDGTAPPRSTHCAEWTSNSLLKTAYYGESYKMTAEWTISESFDNPDFCISNYALYCFKTL